MDLNPFDALGNVVLGFWKDGELQGWIRLFVSCLISILITFLGVFGITLGTCEQQGMRPSAALLISLATACTASAASLASLWIKSPYTKGIPILYPFTIEAKRIAALQHDGGDVYDDNQKGKTK